MLEDAASCERCGARVPESSAFGGACPRCMFELGFESGAEDALASIPGALDASAELPAAIARYRVVRLIGEGGMGAVYEAEQDHPRRTVALKIIKAGISNPTLLRRFEQESQVLGRLQHPGIAQIYEAGTADTGFGPQPYFAMEFVRGKTIRDYAETSQLNARDRLTMVSRIADAVHHAHQRGVIHRDLKPGNVIVDEHGQPKILDFGIARATDSDTQATSHTDAGQLLGTLAYMSPEQMLADPLEIDIRSDVYSLGVILYELLAGRLPFATKKLPETIRAIREEDPVRLGMVNRSYRGDIETIVATALEKDRDRRYGSAGELAADIQRYLRDEPIVARPPSARYQLQKFARRNRALVAGVAAVFVVLVAGIVATTVLMTRARRAEADKETLLNRAVVARNRAGESERRAESERDRADIERQKAVEAIELAQALRIQSIWQSLSRASVVDSASRADDDLAALLARQAMLFHARIPGQPSYLVEDALQRASNISPWSHNLLSASETDVYSVAFSSDGVYFAAGGSDHIVRVWDLRKPGVLPVLLRGHGGPVSSVAFSSDNTRLASGGGTDNTVRVWDLRKPGALPTVLQFSPVLATPVWRVDPTGAAPLVLEPPRFSELPKASPPLLQGKVNAVAFSPDGDRLAAAGLAADVLLSSVGTSYIVHVWNLRNPEAPPIRLRQAQRTATGLNRAFSPNGALAFSPDGNRLACGNGDHVVRVWDLVHPDAEPTLLEVPELPYNALVYSVAFSPDGARLASASGDHIVRVWNWRNADDPIEAYATTGVVRSVAFSRDGATLAAGSSDGAVRLFRLDNREPSATLQGHSAPVNAVAFSSDGGRLASGGSDKTLRMWDLGNRARGSATLFLPASRVPGNEYFSKTSAVFSRDGTRLAVGGPQNAARVWNLLDPNASPILVKEEAPERPLDGPPPKRRGPGEPLLVEGGPEIQSIAFSSDGRRLATGGKDNFVRVWDLRNPKTPPMILKGSDSFVNSVVFSEDGAYLASGGGSGSSIRVWNLRKPSAPHWLLKHSDAYVYSVAFSPDGRRLAVGNQDFVVELWDLRSAPPRVTELRGHQSFVQSVTFSSDGRLLATGSSDGTARVWDMSDSGVPPVLLQNPNAVVYSVALSRDSSRLAVGSSRGVRIFDLRDPTAPPIVLQSQSTTSVAFSPDGTRLAAGAEDGSVRVWRLWSAAADFLCARISRNLSADEWRRYVGDGVPYERTCPGLPSGHGAREISK